MLGVVADITEEKLRPPAAPPRPRRTSTERSRRGRSRTFLGVAEATVKRLTASGGMQFLRSSRKNSRRFAPEDVLDYLRRGTTSPDGFDSAVRAQDMNGLPRLPARATARGHGVRGPARRAVGARRAPRAAYLGGGPARPDAVPGPGAPAARVPALLAQAGNPEALEGELIACALQAEGLEVLRPAGAPQPGEIAELARRVRARLVVLTMPRWARAGGLAAASEIAAAGSATVCLRCEADVRVPRGVNRFHSMAQLGSILRGS